MKACEMGLVHCNGGKKKPLRYFTKYEMIPITKYNVKVGEFMRVTFSDGSTKDIYDRLGKDRVISAIEHIHRFPQPMAGTGSSTKGD